MDRHALADRVARRRLALGLTGDELAAKARMTRATVSRIENGHPVARRTLWKLDNGLGWKPGSAEEFLATGVEPAVMPENGEVYTDPDEAAIWGITRLDEQRRREWIAVLRRTRTKESERPDEDIP